MNWLQATAAGVRTGSRTVNLLARLRASEKVALGFLAYGLVASLVFPFFPLREHLLIVGLNLIAGAAVLLASRDQKPSRAALDLRDWFPAVLILLAYRESGLFLRPDPAHQLDYLFIRWDRAILGNSWVLGVISAGSPWLEHYLEFSYLLCYPLVPLGLAALYLAQPHVAEKRKGGVSTLPLGVREENETNAFASPAGLKPRPSGALIDRFWTAVLLATLSCYAVYPFFPLTPPRVLFHDLPWPAVEPLLRKMNFWVLDRYSVQACIFPSGHVAAVTAVALAVRAYLPRLGVLFLIAAASITLATVLCRYHYAADALAGALVGVAAFWISSWLQKR